MSIFRARHITEVVIGCFNTCNSLLLPLGCWNVLHVCKHVTKDKFCSCTFLLEWIPFCVYFLKIDGQIFFLLHLGCWNFEHECRTWKKHMLLMHFFDWNGIFFLEFFLMKVKILITFSISQLYWFLFYY